MTTNSGLENTRKDDSGRTILVLGAVLLSLALMVWLLGPVLGEKAVTMAYEGRAIPALNSLITGQSFHPLQAYLSEVESWIGSLAYGLLALSALALGLSRLDPGQRAVSFPLVLACLPPAYLIYFVSIHWIDMPLWDQWEMVPLLTKVYERTASFSDFWRPIGPWRPLVPNVVTVVFAYASDWNIYLELLLNVVLSVCVFGLVAYYIHSRSRAEGVAVSPWTYLVLSLLVFSMTQYENWLWGLQISYFMTVFFVTVGLFSLAMIRAPVLRDFVCILLGVALTYTSPMGLVYWPVALVTLILLKRPGEALIYRVLVWLGVAATAIYLYAVDLPVFEHLDSLQTVKPAPGGSLPNPVVVGGYLLTYLGRPVGATKPIAFAAGVIGLFAFLYLVAKLRASRLVRFEPMVPIIALGVYSVGVGLEIALGRSLVDNSLDSRYSTMSMLFWVSLASLTAIYSGALKRVTTTEKGPSWGARTASMAAPALVLLVAVSYWQARESAIWQQEKYLRPSRDYVAAQGDSGYEDQDLTERLHFWAYGNFSDMEPGARFAMLTERLGVLRKYQLATFRR